MYKKLERDISKLWFLNQYDQSIKARDSESNNRTNDQERVKGGGGGGGGGGGLKPTFTFILYEKSQDSNSVFILQVVSGKNFRYKLIS